MTTLEKLIEFEGKYDVLKFRFHYKNLLVWPYIRTHLFNYIINVEENIVINRSPITKKNMYQSYIKHNTFKMKDSEVLFLTEAITLVEENGKWSDRIVQSYINVIGDRASNIIRVGCDFDYPEIDRSYVTLEYIQDLIQYDAACCELATREYDVIQEFIRFLKQYLPFQLESGAYGFFRGYLEKTIKALPYYYKYYERLIKKTKPKVIFWNCASYSEPAIKVLNDLGVITAEFQHGYIGNNHQAYNFSHKIKGCDEYASYLPKYFLSYGSFWTREMMMIPQPVSIGNPIVSKNIALFADRKEEECDKNILLIESNYTHKYIEYIKEMLEVLPNGYKIFIKLHPSTLTNRRYYRDVAENDRVSVVDSGTVYEWFEKCGYVLGDTSTALYEAAAVGKHVYIIDSEASRKYIKEGCGIRVKSGYEVCHNIENVKVQSQNTCFFETNWKENFQRFLEDECKIIL